MMPSISEYVHQLQDEAQFHPRISGRGSLVRNYDETT